MQQNPTVPGTPDRQEDGRMEELTADIVRIPLPLPLTDLRVINAYAIHGTDGVTLVDPGWADERSEVALIAALDQLGYQPGDVRRILVTHAHWDHYSRAIDWQRRYGATVYLGHEERHSIAAFETDEPVYSAQAHLLRRAGAPTLASTIADYEYEPYERNMPVGPADIWLSDGDEIDCGGVSITALATPGHTRGHMVFEVTDDAMVFSGDHILPRITPSIALERVPEPLPLQSYLASLELFAARPDLRMLPAHGPVTASLRARVDELFLHHLYRLDTVLGHVEAGCRTAYEVARRMTWTRHNRTIDELGALHGTAAILEVAAHLELLAIRGQLTVDNTGDTQRYTAR